jgi:hypothetical protein
MKYFFSAPSCWCINTSSKYLRYKISLTQIEETNNFKFEYLDREEESKFKFGDKILTIDNSGKFKSLVFKYFGEVIGHPENEVITKSEVAAQFWHFTWPKIEETKIFRHVVALDLTSLTFDNSDNQIENYAYSIPGMDYIFPDKYFNSAIKKIDLQDYNNIINNRIFIARTAFGMIVNSLPIDNRIEIAYAFVKNNYYERPEIKDYINALKYVQDFLENSLYPIGKMLTDSYNILEKNFSETFPIKSLGFIDSHEDLKGLRLDGDLLFNQANRFSELFNYLEKTELFFKIYKDIEENIKFESKYNTRFEKVRFPITLNI